MAGTNLLGEDFRLTRAMEGLSPLATASPVFGKIGAALEHLLSAPPEKRGGALLDTLALVDAVVYTQGKTGCSGTLEPLPHGVGACQPLTYTQLQPLLEALSGTGSGRYAVITEFWQTHPEYFSDYRVLPLLVKGLGDRYSTLADDNRDRLIRLGPVSIPLLKEGFDPAGKREMLYRVMVLDALAGAAENDFYRAHLPNAKREVRGALISALQHHPDNLPLLLELCQKERKEDNRRRTWRALAQFESPEVEAALKQLPQTDWELAMYTLAHTNTSIASRLTAQLFEEELALFDADPDRPLTAEHTPRFQKLLDALYGKTGPEVCQLYRHAAALTPVLERPLYGGRQPPRYMRFPLYNAPNREGHLFGLRLAWTLAHTLMLHPDGALCNVALEFYEQDRSTHFAPALVAQLHRLSSGESYQWAVEQMPQNAVLRQSAIQTCIEVLGRLVWSSPQQTYGFKNWMVDYNDRLCWHTTPIPNLDVRWFSLFAQSPDQAYAVLLRLLHQREAIPNLPPQVLECLYEQTLQANNFSRALDAISILCAQRWSDWDDFAVKWANSREARAMGVNFWEVFRLLENLPIPPDKKADQLQTIHDLMVSKKLKVCAYQSWLDGRAVEQIALWKQQASTSTS